MNNREIFVPGGREYQAPVFTPPRDDFAGLTKQGNVDHIADVEGLDLKGPHEPFHSTRQALSLVMRAICFFVVVFCVIVVSYFFETILIAEPVRLACHEQPIRHGKLLPGVAGSEAVVECNKGYRKGAPVLLSCLPVAEKCVVLKKATVMKEEVKRCWRRYAYVSPAIEKEALLNGTVSTKALDKEEGAQIPHACLAMMDLLPEPEEESKSKLFKQQAILGASGAEHAPLITPATLASLAMFILASVAVFLIAGLARARAEQASYRYQCPPSAIDDMSLDDDFVDVEHLCPAE